MRAPANHSCVGLALESSTNGFSLVLKHLKVCDNGTEVLNDLTNLDFQVQHLELDSCCVSIPSVVLSIRELEALTLQSNVLSSLCDFLISALQSKLNLHFLSLRYNGLSASDQWYLTQLFYLTFSFPELETFKFHNKVDDLLIDVLSFVWRKCGARKLKELHLSLASDCNLEKLNAMHVALLNNTRVLMHPPIPTLGGW